MGTGGRHALFSGDLGGLLAAFLEGDGATRCAADSVVNIGLLLSNFAVTLFLLAQRAFVVDVDV